MRPPLVKLLPELQREAQEAIEKFAASELKPELVRMRMYDAAKLGQRALRLRLPMPVDMRGTKAAATLVEWCKENGFQLTWETREAEASDGRRVTVWEPEISWHVL